MKLKISSLDLSLQTRVTLNDDAVEEYAQLMSDGKVFPPVSVYDTEGVLSLVDGFHRVAAMTRLGKDEVEATVTQGTHVEALSAALLSNDKHGLRRTNADKRHCLEMAWLNRDTLFDHFDGKDKDGKPNGLPSKRQLAEKTGLSDYTTCIFLQNVGVVDSTTPTPAAKYDADSGLGEWKATDLERRAQTAATKVTKEHLEERDKSVAALLKEGKDRFGVAIPEKLLAAFRSREPAAFLRDVKSMRAFLEKRVFGADLAFAGLGQSVLAHFDNIIGQLKFWTPWCVCRGCRGEGCAKCSYRGIQTKAQYERNPEELKAEGGKAE